MDCQAIRVEGQYVFSTDNGLPNYTIQVCVSVQIFRGILSFKSMQCPLRSENVVDLEPIGDSFELPHRANPRNETRVIIIKT
jgi:hypothetical protein